VLLDDKDGLPTWLVESPPGLRRASEIALCKNLQVEYLMRSRPARRAALDAVHQRIRRCVKCRLCEGRTRAVPGEGPVSAPVMFVGEAPGGAEDVEGRPFAGRAGKFFDDMLSRLGLTRARAFVTNSVKCRPPQNRAPREDELTVCREHWLERQIDLVAPKIVVLLGTSAIKQRFGGAPQLSKLHGDVRTQGGRTYFLTYHPASAMRFPNAGRAMNEDLKFLTSLVAGHRR
jgi:uracil-DNA glycosylase